MSMKSYTKIAIGWTFAVSIGLYSFYLSKQYVDSHRYEAMKARERIARAAEDPTKVSRPIPKQFSESN